MSWRVALLVAVTATITVAVFLFPAIPQSESYHHFADTRAAAGIPNALNVLSNAFFLIVGWLGMGFVLSQPQDGKPSTFLNPRER